MNLIYFDRSLQVRACFFLVMELAFLLVATILAPLALLSAGQAFKAWSGYAFESICLKHIPQIKKAMSIAGIYSLSGSFYKKGTDTEAGAQIDLLIDRNDHVINLFEIKFHNQPYTLTKAAADQMREKMRIFKETTKTRKQLSWVFISTFGLKTNSHSLSLIAKSLTMDDLFFD